jgi:hypothetical protein
MERRLLASLRRWLRRFGRRLKNRRFTYTDATIIEVYMWAVINDRPTCWSCDTENWRGVVLPPGLPSPAQMSRRLRAIGVARLVARLERWVLRQGRCPTLACMIDGHALEIAPHSADRHAGYGRARRGMAKGYKLHAVIDFNGTIWTYRVTPMNRDERAMARRMRGELPPTCYLLADANYNSNKVFRDLRQRDIQLIAPRRERNAHQGIGHHRQDAARLRSIDLLENRLSDFGRELLAMRRRIEGYFGAMCSHANGLGPLRSWVRSYSRVRAWVQAKLIIHELRKQMLAPE